MGSLRKLLVSVAVVLAVSGLLAASASATFEATLAPRRASERATAPSFVVEAGGGRRTRVRDLRVEGGRCGSIFAALIEAGHTTGGFAEGNGAAVFAIAAGNLRLRLELRVKPRGEGLVGTGSFSATTADCHERIPLDLVSTSIRGGGRHRQD